MDKLRCILGACFLLTGGYMCMPVEQVGPDNFNCDEKFNCSDIYDPVCGSDGVTYESQCHLNLEYQRHVCEIGDFNPIAFVHSGNCSETIEDGTDRAVHKSGVY